MIASNVTYRKLHAEDFETAKLLLKYGEKLGVRTRKVDSGTEDPDSPGEGDITEAETPEEFYNLCNPAFPKIHFLEVVAFIPLSDEE